MKHISVMLDTTINLLNIKPDGIYVDATLGRGGHSRAILEKLEHGMLVAFDRDIAAIETSKKYLSNYADNLSLVHTSFSNMKDSLEDLGITEVDGVLFDLGVSSPQFDDETRGFSYRFDYKLDMRMDQSQSLSAYEVVNNYSEKELIRILKEYGEERYAKGIVREIIANRPIETTFELVDCIKKAYPAKELRKAHPAKQTFQAIRIEVNAEFEEINAAIDQALSLLKIGGRLVVITFHSLEDRIVKKKFNEVAKPKKVDPRIPIDSSEPLKFKLVTKAIKPSKEEIEENNRAHSAMVRCVERVI